jgi:hypothetical protein
MQRPLPGSKGELQIHLVKDLVLAHPYESPANLARMCSRSQAWLVRLLNADWFQAILRERRAEISHLRDRRTPEQGAVLVQLAAQERLHELLPTASVGQLLGFVNAFNRALKPSSRPGKRSQPASYVVQVPIQRQERGAGYDAP